MDKLDLFVVGLLTGLHTLFAFRLFLLSKKVAFLDQWVTDLAAFPTLVPKDVSSDTWSSDTKETV